MEVHMFRSYLVTIGIVSLIEILLFSYDKVASSAGRFRIPVFVLMLPIGFGGAVGALFSLVVYHHKTRKMFFTIPLCFSLIVQVILGAIICFV
jgi:uncharacterized membrane protein YsdA (DUF1294 family)